MQRFILSPQQRVLGKGYSLRLCLTCLSPPEIPHWQEGSCNVLFIPSLLVINFLCTILTQTCFFFLISLFVVLFDFFPHPKLLVLMLAWDIQPFKEIIHFFKGWTCHSKLVHLILNPSCFFQSSWTLHDLQRHSWAQWPWHRGLKWQQNYWTETYFWNAFLSRLPLRLASTLLYGY